MKKTLVALAALAATSAFAQSSVEIYGIVDVGYTSHKIDDGEGNANSVAKRTIVGSNGLSTSRLGFRGTEDIGNGTKAGFTFELGLAPAGGTPSAVNGAQPISAVDNRQAFVTLSNDKLGTVNVGRQYTHAHAIQAGYNAGGTNNVVGDATYSQIEATPLGTNLTGPTNGISGLRADALNSAVYQLRASNAVSYMLPTLAQGLTLGVSMSTVNTANNGTDVGTKGTSLMAKYETGPLSLGFSHAKGTTKAAGGTTADGAGGAFNGAVQAADIKATNTVLGASYAIDNAKLFYTRVVLKQEQLADSQKRVAQKVGVNATYGAWVPFVQIGTIKDTEETGLAGFKHKLRQIGTTYNLSKRTTAYAIYGSNKVTSQADATWTGKETQTAIGVRHSF